MSLGAFKAFLRILMYLSETAGRKEEKKFGVGWVGMSLLSTKVWLQTTAQLSCPDLTYSFSLEPFWAGAPTGRPSLCLPSHSKSSSDICPSRKPSLTSKALGCLHSPFSALVQGSLIPLLPWIPLGPPQTEDS